MRGDTLDDMSRIVPLARVADPAWTGDTYILAAALYRASRYEESAQCFDAATKLVPPRASHACFGAMAHYRLGHVPEARRLLAEARRWTDEANRAQDADPSGTRPAWGLWYEPILYPLLLHEAEELIGGNGIPPTNGTARAAVDR
jgi:hypothetical protein